MPTNPYEPPKGEVNLSKRDWLYEEVIRYGGVMPAFWKKDDLFCVNITTGPTCVTLRLALRNERLEVFEIVATFHPALKADAETAKRRILEGTDAANQQYSSSWHPHLAKCSVDDYTPELLALRRAAFAIVERLAIHGEEGFEDKF